MSQSTHITGFRPADKKWNQFKTIWETCENAGIPIPEEVYQFFEYDPPGDKPGMDVDISGAVNHWSDNLTLREGVEVDLSKLPEGITVLRFYNSY